MHTRASNSELVKPLSKPERTLNRSLRRQNKRVLFERWDKRPEHPKVIYPPILDITHFCHFLNLLENHNPMDDEPMWAVNRVVALTLGPAITIPETANEFAIKGNSNPDTDKIMARMDAITIKMDAQYKQIQSCAKRNHCEGNVHDLKTKLETTTKNHQAIIQNLEAKFAKLADKQFARPSGSLPSNTQPNPLENLEDQYRKFLDMIRVIRINVPLVDILAGMPNYGKFLKELISNKHKLEQISSAYLSDESSAMIQNKVPPKLEEPESFLFPCTFGKTFSYNALADLGASINLMPYSLYAKLSLETLKPTKMSVILTDRSFQYPIGIAKNILVEVGKFTFPMDFVILEMEEDKEYCDALLDEGSKILYSIEGNPLEDKIFSKFDELIAMNIE
ncbi:reverse transcriptase domain-containing protein [Tanacetum coccineum]